MNNILKLDKSTIADSFSNEVIKSDKVKLKLTPKQNCIIYALQKGCVLITGNQYSSIWLAGNKG